MRTSAAALALLLAACGTERGGGGGGAGGGSGPAALAGGFVWESLDGAAPPVVFPVGSGMTLLNGRLELVQADSAAQPRFEMQFTFRQGSSDSTTSSGEQGSFRIGGDTLFFTPDGREDRPPVSFLYRWANDATLELLDVQGHVWRYGRAPGRS